jgi:signal transduction histidine kinase
MRISLRATILATFTALAVASLLVGSQVARRESVERLARDRGSHEQLAFELSAELNRLDALYESHLRRLLDQAESDTGPRFISACRDVIGVRHYSRLGAKPGSRDLQVDCRWPGGSSVSVPVFENNRLVPGTSRKLDPGQFFGPNAIKPPWLREPGKPTLFFANQDNEVRILVIDNAEVNEAIEKWMRAWLHGPFSNIAAAHGTDRIVSPWTAVLAASGDQPSGAPDWVSPVRSQFGTWRIESWDTRTTTRTWHTPTLAWSIVAAVFSLLVGFALAARAGQERQLAEQRVSFVNRVSHELRTPLTNMLLNLDVASEHIEEGAACRRLDLVREEARRLSRLIENVLTFSQRDRGGIDVNARACDPTAVIDAVIEQFAASFSRREIRVERTVGPMRTCLIDSDALAQIIANLLSNVEKYAPVGTVEIRTQLDGEELVITVADEGPGIPSSAAERIFEPFERVNNHLTEGVTGTGLGLAIAREIVHRMSGTLRLMPSARGARFELRVPAPIVPNLGSFAA